MITEQFRVTQDYLREQGLSQSFPERFFSKIHFTEDCWIWIGGKSTGYGSIAKGFWKGSTIMAHKASWVLHFGPVPIGAFICHDCPTGDNRLCVNPAHLYLGDSQSNVRDEIEKEQYLRGSDIPVSKLHESLIQEIFEWRKQGLTQLEISQKYDVDRKTISCVLSRKTWRHVPVVND